MSAVTSSHLSIHHQNVKILEVADKEIGNIGPYSIFTPSCPANAVLSKNKLLKRLRLLGRLGEKYDPCTEKHSTVYLNLPHVEKALHVNPAFAPSKWEMWRYNVDALKLRTVTPWYAWYDNGQVSGWTQSVRRTDNCDSKEEPVMRFHFINDQNKLLFSSNHFRPVAGSTMPTNSQINYS